MVDTTPHGRVLVVGGAGYIGSQTCKALGAVGFLPVTFDNFSTGFREFVRWGPLVEGDLRDKRALFGVFSKYRPVAVLHLAACAYVQESVKDPAKYYWNNVVGTLHLLDAAREAGNVPIVFSSSCSVYGVTEKVPIAEDAPLAPINAYGRTKLAIEYALADYEVAYGLRSIQLRYFNACGCDLDGEVGESHDPETHLIPRAVLAAMGRIENLEIFGDDYETADGTAIRDYIHVCDLASAHVAALGFLVEGGPGGAFNVGTGKGISVREIVRAVERVAESEVPVRVVGRRPGDVATLVADSSRARRRLGFSTMYSDIDTIVRTAHAWIVRRQS